ncbi:MAG: flagellin, partial [bacterium]
ANGATTGQGLAFVEAGTGTVDSGDNGYDIVVTQTASKSNLQGNTALTTEMVQAGETLTATEGGISASYTTSKLDTVETAVQNFASALDKAGLGVTVSKNHDNTVSVAHKEYGSKHDFKVSSTSAGILSKEAGTFESSVAGNDIKGTLNGESASGEGQVLTGREGTKHVEGLSVRYTGSIAESAPVEGQEGEAAAVSEEGTKVGTAHVAQNSLTFQVGANQGQTVGISLKSTSSSKLATGIENASGFNSLADLDVTNSAGSQDAIGMIDKAINEISTTRAELGAFQKNTLESNVTNLRNASENMSASESNVRDADMAAEMATFTRNQIMTQSATAMLSQANNSPKGVLRLLG